MWGVLGWPPRLRFLAQDGPGGFSTRATSAYVLDLSTGTVLLDKNADQPLAPASMSKLMTLEMLFEAIKEGPPCAGYDILRVATRL